MIWDPKAAARALRERILESMTDEELEEYAKSLEAQADAVEVASKSDSLSVPEEGDPRVRAQSN